MRRLVAAAAALGLFVLLTIVATWPQARVLATEATPHQDVYFNMWRLEWVAHALKTPAAHLFDANIFYPERQTLALSDAMPVEGVVAAPLVWAGVRPVLIHNLLLLGAIACSGAAMFALAAGLTGSRGAGVVAGIVFAYAPYRFEHAMHMELQWTMWMPLAFLALHRTFETGRWKYGVATGACMALQMLSSIYYGLFLATLLPLAGAMVFGTSSPVMRKRALMPLVGGALLAVVVCGIYARPYLREHQRVGDRSVEDVRQYSAQPRNYLAATPGNWLYGRTSDRYGAPERRLFPGAVAALLALAGLILRPRPALALVYLLLLAASFEASLGFSGYSYSFLHDHVPIFRSLRATARLGVFVLMFLAVLAACGYRAIVASCSPPGRRLVLGLLTIALLIEYHVSLQLVPYPNAAPPVYRMLAAQPRGVVAEFPVPHADSLPGDEAEYQYMSTFHWFPLVNGYSGNYPRSYIERLDRLTGFPDERSLRQLKADGVRYIVVHGSGYPDGRRYEELNRQLLDIPGLVELGSFPDAAGQASLYVWR